MTASPVAFRRLSCAFTVLALLALSGGTGAREPGAFTPARGDGAQFTFLTYNVAGLPGLLSKSDPERNTPIVSRMLNHYDLVVVQEDFVYHDRLSRRAAHAFRSHPITPSQRVGIGDGLNRFSKMPFTRFGRHEWKACNGRFSAGADCFAAKGFTVGEHELAPDLSIDVYNVHMDSGRTLQDLLARQAQVDQLLDFMERRSKGRSVIVAGDTNMGKRSEALLARVLKSARLTDACRELACPAQHRIDRVMYRSSSRVELRAENVWIDPRFVRKDGVRLSDHDALGVVFRWKRRLF